MSALQVLKRSKRVNVAKPKATEHPYIVRVEGVCGGRPIIRGTRISVRHIAVMYKSGDTVEEILRGYPQLKAAAVHDALSYYHDHQREIEKEIRDNRIENVLRKHHAVMDERGRIIFKSRK